MDEQPAHTKGVEPRRSDALSTCQSPPALIALIQRVTRAQVTVAGETVGAIGNGLVALVGVAREDEPDSVARLARRVASYRVFPDADGRMNLSVSDIHGAVLVVSQFTLAADTDKGTRASFSKAAVPEIAAERIAAFVQALSASGLEVQTGRFGADMQVELVNDGPVTFWLQA